MSIISSIYLRLSRLFGGEFFRSVQFLVAGSVVSSLVMLLSIPIVSRLYNPSEMGSFAIVNSIVALFLVPSSLRYELAIPLSSTDQNARLVTLFAFAINIVVSVFLALVVLIFGRFIFESSGLEDAYPWILAGPLILLGGGSYKVLQYWAVRKKLYTAIAQTKVVQSIINVGLQIALGLVGFGISGLIMALFFGYASGTKRLLDTLDAPKLGKLRRSALRRVMILARRFSRFPKIDVLASSVNSLSLQLPSILLAAYFGSVFAGYYFLATRVLQAPLGVVGEAIGKVLYGQAGSALADGTIKTVLFRIVIGVVLISIVPVISVSMYGAEIFAYVFGSEWTFAGEISKWIVISICFQLMYSSISTVLQATNGQKLFLVIQLSMLISRFAAIYSGYIVGSAVESIMALALVSSLGYLIACVLVITHASSYSRAYRAT